SALRIVSDPERAESLVGAILGRDRRFARGEDGWTAVERNDEPALERRTFLLVDAGRARSPGGPAPLFLQAYDAGRAAAGETVPIGPEGEGLEVAGTLLRERLPVGLVAGPARRQLHRLERTHGIPAVSERMIDLGILLALLDLPVPEEAGRDAVAPPEERLHACRRCLDEILERIGSETLTDLEAWIARTRPGEPVDFSRFRFGSHEVVALPERPGVYRFLGDGDRILYVGKSRNLRRRVSEYFRPLAPEHARRARLLSEVRDLRWETTPSELEALLIEAESIRRLRPPHNRQIEITLDPAPSGASESDAGFVLCEGDPSEVSFFLLREGRPWMYTRLPRGSDAWDPDRVEAVLAAWRTGDDVPGTGLRPIEDPEAVLVLRYLRIYGDRTDRILREEPGDREAAEALRALAMRDRPDEDRWWIRAGKSSESGGPVR
ncbi:MAG: hypothetical protein GF346_00800, partial [Candidatus Eisenbacteria bacterium]|nr:hypothetical protein [Candidatus Latescibacterota bacterium]MBD3300970.1 hypothetical protein [Candidatus Eisenbacteria bacterium]